MAGESDLVNAWVNHKCITCGFTKAIYNVDNPSRKTSFDCKFCNTKRC